MKSKAQTLDKTPDHVVWDAGANPANGSMLNIILQYFQYILSLLDNIKKKLQDYPIMFFNIDLLDETDFIFDCGDL